MGGMDWLKSQTDWRTFLPSHEPSFGARPVPVRSGSDSLLVPEPSPSRLLHSNPLRAGTSRAPDAGGFRGARRDKSSERSLLGERDGVRASFSSVLTIQLLRLRRLGLNACRSLIAPCVVSCIWVSQTLALDLAKAVIVTPGKLSG